MLTQCIVCTWSLSCTAAHLGLGGLSNELENLIPVNTVFTSHSSSNPALSAFPVCSELRATREVGLLLTPKVLPAEHKEVGGQRRRRADEEGMGAKEAEEDAAPHAEHRTKKKTSKEVCFSVLPDKYQPLIEEEEEETPEERRKRKEEKKSKKKEKYKRTWAGRCGSAGAA
ncbi:uncharacterized protein LOC115004962 isoform X2 [Cottoperca gobio]|uniref:Uncharacterized protein LOC115004962 isoform X2 n=1 Tax=Cottoperca gobio TaxID=56716 RepID=A0A6J2PBN8_COTGO|nr:uncharacterized protein LOC115004962 isoform X2 [Cottoperca gobio]